MGSEALATGARRRARRLRSLWPWLALFAGALAVRSLRFGLVFVDGEVRFPHGADEFYHLRRIWFSVVNFPAALSFDPYLNHPEGAAAIWTPVFDWTIAALARAAVGVDRHAVESFAAWVPPVLGALAVLAAAGLARRTFSPAAGWVTGALLAVLPAHVFYSALGVVDHHVAVGLFATLLLAAAMRLAGPLRKTAGWPRGVAATGGMIAAAILLWPGFLLHVLVVQAFLVAQLLATGARADARARALGLAAAHGLAAAVLLPFCAGRESREFGSLSPLMLSNFQPLWFGAAAAALAAVAWLWGRAGLGATRARRVGSAAALAAAGLAAAWLAIPGLAASLENAAGWFEPDPFLGVIAELQPLLAPDGRFEAWYGHANYSHLFWAFPLALAGLLVQALVRRRTDVLLLLWTATAFVLLTLYQQRFGDVSAAGFALVMGPALVEGFRAARARFRAPPAAWVGAALLVAAVAGLAQAPDYRMEAEASLAALRGGRLGFLSHVRRRMVLERAARWLERETPPTAGWLDPTAKPAYGVLGAWGHGHLLRYYAERPMVQDNFGPWGGSEGFEAARRYFAASDESAAAEIADRLGARYVVATPQGSGQHPPRPGSQALRLVPLPAAGGGLTLPGDPGDALARHRLVFVADDADQPRPRGERPWRAAVFEIVPGARVSGLAPGAAFVHFELALPVGGTRLLYRARARVDDAGRYEIRLPYPSERGWAVRTGAERRTLVIGERDVREGRAVAGPSFAPRAGLTPPP